MAAGRFVTAFKTARHLSLSWARWSQSRLYRCVVFVISGLSVTAAWRVYCLHVWKMALNVLNKQLRTADNRWSSSAGIEGVADKSSLSSNQDVTGVNIGLNAASRQPADCLLTSYTRRDSVITAVCQCDVRYANTANYIWQINKWNSVWTPSDTTVCSSCYYAIVGY